jgi:hypothetical protein
MRPGSLLALTLASVPAVVIAVTACGRTDMTTERTDAAQPSAQGAAAPLVARVKSLAGTVQSVDEVAERAGTYVNGLSNADKARLGKALADEGAAHYDVYGAGILVSVGDEQAAAPAFARFVLNGGDMTGFFWSWLHGADSRTAMRMYIAIAEVLLARLNTLTPVERERAQAFLTADGFGPPITTFSEQAVRDRIEDLRRELKAAPKP